MRICLHIGHTYNFYGGLCPLLSTHTGVDPAVLWIGVYDDQLHSCVPLLNLVLVSTLQRFSSKSPLYRNTRLGDFTVQCDVVSFLHLEVLQLLLEGNGKSLGAKVKEIGSERR